jgi:predicted regulator of Ras-like GTPase activity (Roadblock/LC7/MglB family)
VAEHAHEHDRSSRRPPTALVSRFAQPAETLARFFLAGFDGLMMQHLSHPDVEAEITCLQALISAVVALAGGRLDLAAVAAD